MNRIVKNYLYNVGYQILVMILPIVTTPYVARVLGPDGVGTYYYAYSIVTFLILFAQLGTGIYGQREIAFVQGDIEKRSVLFEEIYSIRFLSLMLIIPIYFAVCLLSENYRTLFLSMGIYIVCGFLDISWYYQGIEDFGKVTRRNVGSKIIGVLLVFLFVRDRNDVAIYAIVLSLSQLIGNIFLWFGFKRQLIVIPLPLLRIRRHFYPIISLFIPTVAMYLYTYIDKVIIGSLTSSQEVGYYSMPERIIRLFLTVIVALGTVLMPNVSNALSEQRLSDVKQKISVSIKFVYLIGIPMVFGIVLTAKRFIPLFLGEEFLNSILIFSLLSPLIIVIGLASVAGQAVLIPMKKQGQYSLSIISGAIVNVFFDFVLIPLCGGVGAALGTILAEMTVTIIQMYYVWKLIDVNALHILSNSYKPLIGSFVMSICIYVLDKTLPEGVGSLALLIVVSVVEYIFVLVVLKEKMVMGAWCCLKKKWWNGEKQR